MQSGSVARQWDALEQIPVDITSDIDIRQLKLHQEHVLSAAGLSILRNSTDECS
jgi:hypothetical protein